MRVRRGDSGGRTHTRSTVTAVRYHSTRSIRCLIAAAECAEPSMGMRIFMLPSVLHDAGAGSTRFDLDQWVRRRQPDSSVTARMVRLPVRLETHLGQTLSR